MVKGSNSKKKLWHEGSKKKEEKLVKVCAEPARDPACQLRQSTNETSLRAAELILEGNKAPQAQPLFM